MLGSGKALVPETFIPPYTGKQYIKVTAQKSHHTGIENNKLRNQYSALCIKTLKKLMKKEEW